MATLNELRTARTKLLLDAQKLVAKKDVTKEERAQAHAMLADVDLLDGDIAIEDRLAKAQAEERAVQSAGRPPREQPGAAHTEENRAAQKKAFVNYMLNGEKRDLLTGSTGAAIIPTGFRDSITEAAKLWGQLAISVKQMPTDTGEPMRIPLANDTGNAFTLLGEAQPATEADPAITGVISQVDKFQSGLVKVSVEMLNDSAFDLDGWLRSEFGKRYWRGISAAITNGSSTGNVQAITSVAVAGVTTGTNVGPVYEDMAAAYGALESAYIPGASWVMSSNTRAYFLGQLDNYGRPLYVPNVNSDNLDKILGIPVVINQFSPNIAPGSTPILLGNLQEAYTFRQAGEIEVMRLQERFMDTYEVGFLGFARISGFGTDAGTHPLIKVTVHA